MKDRDVKVRTMDIQDKINVNILFPDKIENSKWV